LATEETAVNLAWRRLGGGFQIYDIERDYTMAVLEPDPADPDWWHITYPGKPGHVGRMKRTDAAHPPWPQAVPQAALDRLNQGIREACEAYRREHGDTLG
jgi:hypothetical protein